MSSDVIVVGAGPAGSFSALQAAKLGVQVTICEEHGEVEVPTHCTGHVSLAGIRRFDLRLPKKVFENEIKSAIFYSPSSYRFSVRFAFPVTCVINRELFDQHLLHMALNAGVKVLDNTYVDSLLIKKSSVKGVIVKQKKKTEKLVSSIVIDAEGVSSTLLKRAGLPSLNRHMIVKGVHAEVDKIDNIDNDTVEVYLGHSFAPSFFAWIVPRRDGTAKIGLGTEKGNPHSCLRRFVRHNPIARQKLKRSRFTSLVYHPISLGGPISRTFYNGLLIVGDAASHVKPTTGGGVIMGLTCAKIAGKVAAYAVHHKDSSANFLSEYERQWRKEIGFDMMVMKHLRLMLNGFSDKQIDRLIAFCTRLRLDERLKDVKDVDFQGTSLIRIVKSPNTLASMLYFLLLRFLTR
ncbi:MAG: NAD(P)/FAD-dependent oxidoreductase [Candidatus Bathyarchaeia archaeon]